MGRPRKIEEDTEETHYYLLKQCFDGVSITFIRANHFTIEPEFEGKVACFFDEHEGLIAACRDWVEIRRVEKETVDKILSESPKKSLVIEKETDSPKQEKRSGVDLPPEFGVVK